MAAQAAAILERKNVLSRKDYLDITYIKPSHHPAVKWRDAYHVV